jgi:hypothetical protein
MARTSIRHALLVGAFALGVVSCGPDPGAASGAADTSPSPAAAASPTARPTTAPPLAATFPGPGVLEPGRYDAVVVGVSFNFTISTAGWVADDGRTWAKLDWDDVGALDGLPDGAAVAFWSPIGLYADPCEHVFGPRAGRSALELGEALAEAPSTSLVTGPLEVTLGGQPATQLTLEVDAAAACEPDTLYLWYDAQSAYRYVTALGDTIRIWIVEVDGARLVIEAETRADSSAETEARLTELVESIRFEP